MQRFSTFVSCFGCFLSVEAKCNFFDRILRNQYFAAVKQRLSRISLCMCVFSKAMTFSILLPSLSLFPFCREGLHQPMWEAAHWSAVIPSVLWHQAGAEALHWVYGCCGRTWSLLLLVFHLCVTVWSLIPLCNFDHDVAWAGLCREKSWRAKSLGLCLLLALVWGHGWGGSRGWLAT